MNDKYDMSDVLKEVRRRKARNTLKATIVAFYPLGCLLFSLAICGGFIALMICAIIGMIDSY